MTTIELEEVTPFNVIKDVKISPQQELVDEVSHIY